MTDEGLDEFAVTEPFPGGATFDEPWNLRPDGSGSCYNSTVELFDFGTGDAYHVGERIEEGGPDACGILANLWQLIQSVMDDSEPALEALGLSPKAFFLLEAVEEHPFPAELARRMHLPPPTVTYLVKQLEAKGLPGAAGRARRPAEVPARPDRRRQGGARAGPGRPSGRSSASGCGGSTRRRSSSSTGS